MKQIGGLFRYPLKSHGREALTSVPLRAGMTLRWDRTWAVAHDASTADGSEWVSCRNFSIGSKAPKLMAINASLNEQTETLTLTHPERPTLVFNPNSYADEFLEWVAPLVPQNRACPNRILRLPIDRGFTDSDFPSVTICNHASHRAVEAQLGAPLSINRWRGNIWLDGAAAWDEWDWIGRDLCIGDAVLRIRERTERCMATTANPETGVRDADTLGALTHWGHKDFSVRAEVITSGQVAIGDAWEII